MKKALLFLLIAVFAIPAFQACKKGENDPAISLKSRKSRLVGELKLASGTVTIINAGTTTTITFNGSTATISPGGTVSYTETYTINKDGSWEATIFEDGDTRKWVGQWYFMSANKDKEMKDKECVGFVITQQTFTPAGGTPTITSYTSLVPDMVWILDKLSSKEIVAKVEYSATGTSTYSRTGEYTYEKN